MSSDTPLEPEKRRILVVDDEPDMVRIAKDLLEEEGFAVMTASGEMEACRKLEAERPHLILLDVRLPVKNGFEILRDLKQSPTTRGIPVIMVSARGGEQDRILGLELGADDYVAKPYSHRELTARIKAVLRRHSESIEADEILEVGGIQLNTTTCDVRANGRPVHLTPKELNLLQVVLTRPGRVMKKSFLFQRVWGYDHIGSTRTVDVHMEQLRKKLGGAGKQIVTLRGLGYKFIPAGSPEYGSGFDPEGESP